MEPIQEQQLPMEPPPAELRRYLIIRRFFEMLAWTALLSITGIVLNFAGIAGSQKALMICLSLGVLVFVVINVHMLKQCYFDLRDKKMYYLTNYIAYFLYMAATALIYVLCGNTVYAWIFAITKFLRYSSLGISNPVSAAVFHGIMLLVIALAPLGMEWIFAEEEDEDEFYV